MSDTTPPLERVRTAFVEIRRQTSQPEVARLALDGLRATWDAGDATEAADDAVADWRAAHPECRPAPERPDEIVALAARVEALENQVALLGQPAPSHEATYWSAGVNPMDCGTGAVGLTVGAHEPAPGDPREEDT